MGLDDHVVFRDYTGIPQTDADSFIDFMDLRPCLRHHDNRPLPLCQFHVPSHQLLTLSIKSLAFDYCAKLIQTIKRCSVVAGLRFANSSPVLFDTLSLGLRFAKFRVLASSFGQPYRLKTGILLNGPQSV